MVAVGSSTVDLADPGLVTCIAPAVFMQPLRRNILLEDGVIDRL
jgi:hypothetical protein